MSRIKTETDMFHIDQAHKKTFREYIKDFIYPFSNLLYKSIMVFIPNDYKDYKYTLSMCSIFKNEGVFLKEWIEYHLLIGFDHFYLYNNNSDDNYIEVLSPYIEKGIVTLIDWPMQCGQVPSYEHFYNEYRYETKWCAFFDLDEFLCPFKEINVKKWLAPFSKYPSVVIYWKMFGTSGHIDHDKNSPCIEQYTTCQPKWVNLGKVIYNTSFDIPSFERGMMHNLYCSWKGVKIPPVNEAKNFCIWNHNLICKKQMTIQLNHYWSKSYNNYISKFKKGSAVTGNMWKKIEVFLNIEHNCTSVDYTIYRFLIELKNKLTN